VRSLCTEDEGAMEDKLCMVQNVFEYFASVFNVGHKIKGRKGE